MSDWALENWTVADWVTSFTFFGVGIVGLFHWIRYFRLPALRKSRLLFDESTSVRWGLLDVLIIGFIWLTSQALTMQFLTWHNGIEIGQKLPPGLAARFGVINGIVQVVVIGLSLVYLLKRYGHHESEFGFGKGKWKSGFRFGVIAFCMWVPVVWVLQTVLVFFIEYQHPSLNRMNNSQQLQTITDTWIAAVIVAPFVEEILFRGLIQGWLQRVRGKGLSLPNQLIIGGQLEENPEGAKKRPGKKPSRTLHIPAILITSVLFGLAHFSQGPAPISLFVLSLGLGFLYQRTGSLFACIIVHMLLNGVTMVLFSIDLFVK